MTLIPIDRKQTILEDAKERILKKPHLRANSQKSRYYQTNPEYLVNVTGR